jgi:hypothetical protein
MFGIFRIPSAAIGFFFSSWLTMIFWGIIAPDVGVETISYKKAMVVTIALWLIMAPLVSAIAQRPPGVSFGVWRWRRGGWRTGRQEGGGPTVIEGESR